MRFLICLLLLSIIKPAMADWVSICEPKQIPLDVLISKKIFRANGTAFNIIVSEKKPNSCHVITSKFKAEDIDWIQLLNDKISNRMGQRVILQGNRIESELKISEIIPQHPTEKQTLFHPLLTEINILNELKFKTFGVEERVRVSVQHGQIVVQCNEGEKSAGVLFGISRSRLPLLKNINVLLQAQATAEFTLAISDQRRFDKGNPISIGRISEKYDKYSIAIPRERVNHKTETHWALVCSMKKSELSLTSFIISNNNSAQNKFNDEFKTERSMWFWRQKDWQGDADKTLSILKKYNANAVFISIKLNEEKLKIVDQNKLSIFIKLAQSVGIKTWIVEGDPHVVLPDEQLRFVKRAKIFAAYNQSQSANQQLAGIQYDIEPYLVEGYSLDPESWAKAYVQTIKRLKNSAKMSIEIVIPFWWQNQSIDGIPMLDHLVPYIESLNVMIYRTTSDMINRFAQPLLDWGLRMQTPINIALEAGPISDEIQWRFEASDISQPAKLWLLASKEYNILILSKHPASINLGNKNNIKQAYHLVSERNITGDNVTFENKKQDLLDMLPQLEKQWSHWNSFEGVSLHGLTGK